MPLPPFYDGFIIDAYADAAPLMLISFITSLRRFAYAIDCRFSFIYAMPPFTLRAAYCRCR